MIRNVPERGGWLEVVCGPMFCGKSEELIRRLRRAEIAGQRALIVKPRIDDRYDVAHVVSHAGAKMRAVGVEGSGEILALAAGCQAIGIDEVQFLDAGIVEVVRQLTARGAGSSRRASRTTSAASRSARCPSSSASPSSSTSCRPYATAAAARRR